MSMYNRIKSLFELKANSFDEFTAEALEVVNIASYEARSLRHNFVGTEHLLLGLIAERDGTAAQILLSTGADLQRVRQEVIKIWGQSRNPSVRELPFTPSAKRLFETAAKQSRADGLNYIGTEHLLVGLIESKRGVGLQILRTLGVTIGDIERAIQETLRS